MHTHGNFVLFIGRLRFTNVKKRDEADGKTYCCMASNYLMRDNAIGPEHEIKVIGGNNYMFTLTLLWFCSVFKHNI